MCKPFNIIAFVAILGFELSVVQKTNFGFLKIKPVVIIFETAGQSILNDIPNKYFSKILWSPGGCSGTCLKIPNPADLGD